MRLLCCTRKSTWCLGGIVILLTLAVPPTRGEELSDDILEVSQEMVQRERTGDYATAMMLAQKALTIAEDTLGPEVAEVAIYSEYLGGLHLKLGHGHTAEGLFIRALAIREHVLGEDHIVVAVTLRHLAELYRRRGEGAKAVTLLWRALAIDEKALGVDHAIHVMTLQSLGLIFLNEGRYADSEPLILRALSIHDHVVESLQPDMMTILEYYARLLRETGRVDAAVRVETRIRGIHAARMK